MWGGVSITGMPVICNCFVVHFQNPLRCRLLTRGHDFTFPLALTLKRKAAPLFTFVDRAQGRRVPLSYAFSLKGVTLLNPQNLKIKVVCVCEQVPLSSSSSRRTRQTTALPPRTRAATPLCLRYPAGVALAGDGEAGVLVFDCFFVRLGCDQRRGGAERGGEGQREGRAAQSQKEGERSSRRPSRTVSVEVGTEIPRFLTHHFLHLFQRRRKRKKPEQVVLSESGEGVRMTLVSPSACFYL